MRNKTDIFRSGISKTFIGFILLAAGAGCGMGHGTSEHSEAGTVRYKDLPVKYKIAASIPEPYHAEIHAAFNEWNVATGRDVFVYDGTKDLTEEQLSADYTFGENVVLMTNRSGAMPDADGAPAAEGTGPLARTYLKGVSAIRDADIYLFEFDLNYVQGRPGTGDVYSVQTVVMHEAGHILFGSDHSDDPESIMTAQLFPKNHPNEKFGLGASDIKRFYEVYGE